MTSARVLLAIGLLLVPASLRAQTRPAGGADAALGRDAVRRSCTAPARLAPSRPSDASVDFTRAAVVAGAAPLRSGLIRRLSTPAAVVVCAPAGATPARGEARDMAPDANATPATASAAAPVAPWRDRLAPTAVRTGGPELRLLPISSSSRLNTAYPRDRANGAVWAGRGVSTALRGGVRLRWGPLSAALAPTIAWQQNADFETVRVGIRELSPLVRPLWGRVIDWPQRMGTDSFWTVDPGQSYIRVDAGGLAAGLSTENLWWGPALRNPVLLGDAGPGFPHAFLGTARPVDVGIGRLEGELVWGELAESEHFDRDASNDRRLFSGLVLAFEPRGVPGLYLGAARVYVNALPREGLDLGDYLLEPYRTFFVNAEALNRGLTDNVLVSLFGRWVLPASGFELYGEWAREDAWIDLRDLLSEPDHSQGYTAGLQKVSRLGADRWLRVWAEATRLRGSHSFLSNRPLSVFYIHGQVPQGYTHRGQLLGAPIGPGGRARALGADVFADWGRAGIFIEHVRYDEDAYYRRWVRAYDVRDRHDTELTFGVRQLLFLGRYEVGAGVSYSHRRNRDFIDVRDPEVHVDHNWSIDLELAWRPGT